MKPIKLTPHRVISDRAWCKLHLDAHIPPDIKMLENFSATDFVKKAILTGADSFCVFSKCHYGYSYYPTKIGHIHPGLNIDLLGTLLSEFKKQIPNAPLYVYYNLRFSPIDSKLHPDWTMTEQGKVIETHVSNPWKRMCFNSPYRNIVFKQLEEIAEKYPVDGVFLDFSRSLSVCTCKYCQEKYEKETGTVIPGPEMQNYPEYCNWVREDSDRFPVELTNHLHKIKNHISLCSNHCYGIRQPLPVPPQIGFLSEDVQERGLAKGCMESLSGRYYCSLDVPAEIMTTRMVHWWLDWGFKTDDELLLQNAVISSLGLRTDLSDELYPNYIMPERVLKLFKKVFSQSKTIRKALRDAVSEPDIIVLHSSSTYYSDIRPENDSLKMLEPIYGIHNILFQSQFHYQFVNEFNIKEWLKQTKMLILPEQSVLTNETIKVIRTYIEKGGIVIAIGRTVNNKDICELAGIEYLDEWQTPFQFLNSMPFYNYEGENFHIICYGPSFKIKAIDANVVSYIQEGVFSPAGFCHGQPIGNNKSYPAITEKKVGNGKIICLSLSPTISMCNKMYPELKNFMLSLLNKFHPYPFVLSKSSKRVEITHFRKENTHILNLIKHPLPSAINANFVIDKIEPIKNLILEINLGIEPKKVYTINQVPKFEYKNGILNVILNELKIYECLSIQIS
jgi:hypothetical protein